eukprot:TRINITY_DN738_c1_g1_i1.p2 TRINITY_DN738_c1_g1~~TRINITY_DN738_c1_g1_i1.p2  ORF type:complete len:475 (+),score=229.51 TRINITY_DN738_c1_g1_i1:84-1427(+)
MAKKKIRESDGKRLLKQHIQRFNKQVSFNQLRPVLVHANSDWAKVVAADPWLLEQKLVAKPDMMFGKRGKNDLVLLNADFEQAKQFVLERLGRSITMGGVTGLITHFLIEPFILHQEEFYFSISSEREFTHVAFSTAGGVEIESNWEEKVKTIDIPVGETLADQAADKLAVLYEGVPDHLRTATENYLNSMFALFEDLDFVSIETNPFVFVNDEEDKQPLPLDLCAELDDTARFKNAKKWGDLEFPDVFGHDISAEERLIEDLDSKTGASLKLTILNPKGLVWNLVAGGGASVIYADTVCDLKCGKILGNYGEYSGAPNAEQTYVYAKTLIDLATRPNEDGSHAPAKVLLIGGGIANFTDVAKTFQGIVHALKEYKDKINAANMRLYVRRAGPNYQKGLKLIRSVCKELSIPVQVFGPERNMTEIIPIAIDYVIKAHADAGVPLNLD